MFPDRAIEEKVHYIGVLMTRTGNITTDPFFNELLHVIESEIHKQMAILAKVWYIPLFSNDKKCRHENLGQVIREMDEEMDQTNQSEKEGFEAIQKILKEEDRPTGIYCANDITAVGMLKYLSKKKNRYYMPSI